MAVAINCVGQEGPTPRSDTIRHFEHDLQGPRFDPDAEAANFVGSLSRASADPVDGFVSIKTLNHKIPRKARQEFDRAAKYSRKKDYQAAAAALEEAVNVDPDFVEAHANLGAQYVRLGLLDAATKELQRAIDRDPNIAEAHANLAIVFLKLHRDDLAVIHARHAVKLSPTSHKDHYFLGLALSRSAATVAESLEHFKFAAERLPEAKLELDRLTESRSP